MLTFRPPWRRTSERIRRQQQRIKRLRRRLRQERRAHEQERSSHEELRRRHDEATERIAELKLRVDRMGTTLRDPEPDLTVPSEVEEVIAAVRRERLTFLSEENLRVLARQVIAAEAAGRPGAIIEAGTALGGSAIVMAAAKSPERAMLVYDVFNTIPPPSERDGDDVHRRYDDIASGRAVGHGGETYYGYRGDLLAEVTSSFERFGLAPADNNVSLIQGLFEDTVAMDGPVAFAHLDGDWYDSTMVCLERIAPHVVPGGRIVADDYFSWSGCREAVDDYFKDRAGFRMEYRTKMHAVRLP